jgi:uncharacterized protein (TIGR03435 family)
MRLLPQSTLLAVVLAASVGLSQTAPPSITPVTPMAADAHPSFAVATIKPHDPASAHQGFHAHGDRFLIQNETVESLLKLAYGVHQLQIVNAPEWVNKDAYDIDGKTDTDGEPNFRQQQEMIQQLLADRFKLQFHRGKRLLSVYALRVTKGGPKLTLAADPTAQPDQNAKAHGGELTQIYTSASIADFILGMQFFVDDRPIVDQTGLAGRYDISLRYTSDESITADPNAPPGIFTAIQEQLGLKLAPIKTSADVMVIDLIARPSEN